MKENNTISLEFFTNVLFKKRETDFFGYKQGEILHHQ